MGYHHSRRLGQHFLKNKEKLRKIAASLTIEKGETIVEIGPGNGELTKELIKYPAKVVAIEKDGKLYEKLVNSNWKLKNGEFINGDALKILPRIITNYQLPIANYKIAGNIPYYITGKLLRVIGDLITNYKSPPHQNKFGGGQAITKIVFTVQKEVAERICAKPPQMNLLAASVQFWAEPQIIDYISKKDFSPPPKVGSAIIRLTPRRKLVNGNWKLGDENHQLQITNYYELVRALFKQPRKTILNNLLNIARSDLPNIAVNVRRLNLVKLLKKLKINPHDRPQNLNIEEIKKLSGVL